MRLQAVQLIKWLIIALLLACCFAVYAGITYKFHQRYNDRGHSVIWAVNYTNYTLDCYIATTDGYDYIPFSIRPRSKSNEYFEPSTDYNAGCD